MATRKYIKNHLILFTSNNINWNLGYIKISQSYRNSNCCCESLSISPTRDKGKTTSKANKFANLLKSVTETQPDASTEIYPSFFLTNEYQILGVKPVPINENDGKKSNKRISEEPEKIPNNIIEAVRQNLASQIGIAPEKIKLTEVTQESWPNTCLGLQKNDELCGLRLVEGWRLVFSNGQEKWIYRTDNFGKLMRMESKNKTAMKN